MNLHPPVNLKCEYSDNPLGVDTPSPRFSWVVDTSQRNAFQSACQILVATDEQLLHNQNADIWDSGKIETDKNFNISYNGKKLESGQRYFWCVRWWDKSGKASEFSAPAFFEMGLLNPDEWQAKWITKKEFKEFSITPNKPIVKYLGDFTHVHAAYFRTEFAAKKSIKKARVHVCGLGYYELRINGNKVGDHVLDPAQTDYFKTALYATYDITAVLQGKNAVGVILGNGRHVKNYRYSNPKLILQIHLEYEDGDSEIFVSDESWKVSYGPLMENGIYYGETYDARLDMPGWDAPDFDGANWEDAVATTGPALAAQMMPPIRVTDTLKPITITSPRPGTYIFDFEQNFTGWVKLHVRGPRGTEVKLRFSELLDEKGDLNTATNSHAEATDVYILSGDGDETYEPRFTYHGFRYVEVTGFPGVPTMKNLQGCFVHSDVKAAGDFMCSHQLINKIHHNTIWGQLCNLMSIPTDCPQRDERHGWMGDAQIVAEEAILNFDMAAFFSNFLRQIQFAQSDDGALPDVVPPYWSFLRPADPAWGTAYITIAWYVYFYYGDTQVLSQHYDSMRRYVDFLVERSDNHIQRDLGKYGDWCPPGSIIPKKTPVELTSTWYYYSDVVHLAKIASILEKHEEHDYLSKLGEEIKDAFNQEFLKEDQYAAHRVSPVDFFPNQTANTLPLYLNMVPEDKKEKIIGKLLYSIVFDQDYHLDTGILGTRFILDVLSQNGREDVAWKVMTQESYPSLGFMIAHGATTLWERWEEICGGGMNSHNHIMLGSVDAWFYKNVAGIQCAATAWERVAFKPIIEKDLNYATARIKTVKGEFFISWLKEENRFNLTASIPVSASAEIHLPGLWQNSRVFEGENLIRENGKNELSSDEIRFKSEDGRYLIYEVGSGYYQFNVEMA